MSLTQFNHALRSAPPILYVHVQDELRMLKHILSQEKDARIFTYWKDSKSDRSYEWIFLHDYLERFAKHKGVDPNFAGDDDYAWGIEILFEDATGSKKGAPHVMLDGHQVLFGTLAERQCILLSQQRQQEPDIFKRLILLGQHGLKTSNLNPLVGRHVLCIEEDPLDEEEITTHIKNFLTMLGLGVDVGLYIEAILPSCEGMTYSQIDNLLCLGVVRLKKKGTLLDSNSPFWVNTARGFFRDEREFMGFPAIGGKDPAVRAMPERA